LSESQKLQSMFTIHLIESDSGYVHVLTDYAGEGEIVLNMGTQILNTLAIMQPFSGGKLSIAHPSSSDAQH